MDELRWSNGVDRRDLLIAASIVGPLMLCSRGLAAGSGSPITPAVDVRRLGAVGDGVHNDTAAIDRALRVSQTLFFPAGVYLLDRLVLTTGATIVTDGYRTIFQQSSGLPEGVRLLTIIGSNVCVGDCTLKGNIATDTGEQRHGIFVEASRDTGDLSNILIGSIQGSNLRGDVVYVGARDGRSLRNVQVGDVIGANVLRNVVSVVGGRQIKIGRISGSRVGYTHLDIEPDDYNGPIVGCTVSAVNGGFVQIAAQTPAVAVDQLHIGSVELTAPVRRCVPPYQPGLNRQDALTIRNVRSLRIGKLVARGFEGQAIRQVWDPGELTNQDIQIAVADISNCARGSKADHAYIVGNRHATRLMISSLSIDVPRAGTDVVRDCKDVRIRAVNRQLSKASTLIARSSTAPQQFVYALGAAAALYGLGRFVRRK